MATNERWYFDLEQIHNTPSIKSGYDHDKELSCRQQAANFIQDMGQRLQVNQLCINTAIVYMHRFYMFHSFQRFHRTSLASASLFLAAKVEEQPRKLEHVIRFAQICLHKEQVPFDVNSQSYMEQVQDLIMNENILLQTLGFDVAIDHPHTHIVRCCQLVKASKDLAQTSYFMASYSLHLTTMCLQYKPTIVACFCIHLACKWSNWEIPESTEGKPWFWYVEKSVTSELLESLTAEFLNLFEKCPSRLKKKIMALSTYATVPSSIATPQGGPPMQLGPLMNMSQDMDMKKKEMLDSHNPINHVPHPIGGLGAAVASAKAAASSSMMNMPGAGTGAHSHPSHPFIHQNPMVNKGSYDNNLMKKHHYDHSQRSSLPPNLPPPQSGQQGSSSTAEPPYKKLHHPPHHQRDNHNMGIVSGNSNKPSCMFEPPLPPHYKNLPYPQQHSSSVSSDMTAQLLHCSNRGNNNHIPQSQHRSSLPARPSNIRNGGEMHYQEKKYPVEVKREPLDNNKPQHLLGPSMQPAARMKVKTPPPHINLAPPIHQPLTIKPEKSIFSPEGVVSPPQIIKPVSSSLPTTPVLPLSSNIQEIKKESPPPTPRTPVLIKKMKNSPLGDVETQSVPPVVNVTQDTSRQPIPREPPSTNSGESGRERLAMPPVGVSPPPVCAPDTPSKSSHVKKKKKKHKDHKDKHRDKHKHKHRVKDPEPIVITIPKEKITISQPEGLKIKIAKEKISNPPSSTGLKLKISKDKLVKESKKRDRSDEEDEESEQHVSKQHRPNGTNAASLQVKTKSNRFSSVLGKSVVSPIRTRNILNKYECSPPVSPAHIPEYSPTKPCTGLIKTPGHSYSPKEENIDYNPGPTKPCLSPIAATPRYKTPEPTPKNIFNEKECTSESNDFTSPPHVKPFLSPIAATPKRPNKSKFKIKPPQEEDPVKCQTGLSELIHMSPVQNKPFLSPIAATPVHTGKIKTFKSPPLSHVYGPKTPERVPSKCEDSGLPHMSPLKNKPFLSPIAPTPMHTSKTKTFKSPPTKHVYIPLSKHKPSESVLPELSHMTLVESKPFLSPIAPTPRYPSPKQTNSPPVKHCYIPLTDSNSCISNQLGNVPSPTSSSHSSPDHFDTDNNKCDSNNQIDDSFSPERISDIHHSSPIYSPHHQETKVLVSPIQTPAHCPANIISPPSENKYCNLPILTEARSNKSRKQLIKDIPQHGNVNDSLRSRSPCAIMGQQKFDLSLDGKSDYTDDDCKITFQSDIKQPQIVTPGDDHITNPKVSCDFTSNTNREPSPLFSGVEMSGTRCLSPVSRVESGEKLLLSPILTPGHSPPIRVDSNEKSASPLVIPRYSPSDPNHFKVSSHENSQGKVRVEEEHIKTKLPVRRGPRTPPTPNPYETTYSYDPITPARPDPNEIIFKDSNDNHTKEPSPTTSTTTVMKNKSTPKKYNSGRPYQRRPGLMTEFKIPRTNNQVRRHPCQDPNFNHWNGRIPQNRAMYPQHYVRGRGGSRGWNRWESNHQHRPVIPSHPPSQEHFYRNDVSYLHGRERHHFDYNSQHPTHQENHGQLLQMFDPQQGVLPGGNPYDAAVMKHAYETMSMPPEYFMHYQMYMSAAGPATYQPSIPPPLPDEPPPQPPPPPPPV